MKKEIYVALICCQNMHGTTAKIQNMLCADSQQKAPRQQQLQKNGQNKILKAVHVIVKQCLL